MKIIRFLCIFLFLSCLVAQQLTAMPSADDTTPLPPPPSMDLAPAQTPTDVPPPPPSMDLTPAQMPTDVPPPPLPLAPQANPATNTTPEIKPEQLKGPDILELSEEKPGLTQTNNPNILSIYKNSEKISADASKILNEITLTYENLTKNFFSINTEIDTFFQEATFNKGKIEEQIGNIQKELNQLNQIIQDIKNTKKTLKDQITQLDAKLAEARTDVASMPKTSKEVLSKTQETDAQTILNTLNTMLSKISVTKTLITSDYSRTFDDNITKIKALIKQGQDLIKILQANCYQNKISQEQIQTIKENEKQSKALPSTITKKLDTKQKPQEPKWKQFVMFIISETLDATAYIVNNVISTFKSIYGYFFAPTVNQFVSDVKEKIKEEERKPHE